MLGIPDIRMSSTIDSSILAWRSQGLEAWWAAVMGSLQSPDMTEVT